MVQFIFKKEKQFKNSSTEWLHEFRVNMTNTEGHFVLKPNLNEWCGLQHQSLRHCKCWWRQGGAQGGCAPPCTLSARCRATETRKDGERTACMVRSWHTGTDHCFLQMSGALPVRRERDQAVLPPEWGLMVDSSSPPEALSSQVSCSDVARDWLGVCKPLKLCQVHLWPAGLATPWQPGQKGHPLRSLSPGLALKSLYAWVSDLIAFSGLSCLFYEMGL